ncbi:DUF882 domain-containing protein [Methylomonas sp. SURF-2]|uniref:Murein endopeptidase K n=1 Tax=Methylomonas subterranea TaxID=2952225 RepID=A0ABT1TD57_9GAMM|nr:DUF882 domain-containing protein [Methylomonas sp. SURF-2]MCQ8103393.1 DUF882 domain-containing protein [Methylomonas sp. SURF-2]
MLKHNAENNARERDEVELSRRGFFGRLAVGAVLSIGMPGVVYAAKPDKNKPAQTRSAVRIPKKNAVKAVKSADKSHKGSAVRPVGENKKVLSGGTKSNKAHIAKLTKAQKTGKAASDHRHATASAQQKQLHSARQNARVRDVYTGKNQPLNVASQSSSHTQAGRQHSIIQPGHREPLIQPEMQNSPFMDHGRFGSHRSLAFLNPHTGDKLNVTYFEKGRYLSDALEEVSFLLRDYRTGDVHSIDPELLDQLHDLKQMLGLSQPFGVICGYRSPMTNARLHAEHSGVANNSFHIHGRAVDIRIERFDLRRIHSAAIAMHRGGVGFYPESNFIHLDTGTFRTWTL